NITRKKLGMERIRKKAPNQTVPKQAVNTLPFKGGNYKEMPLTFYMMETRFTPFPLVELIQKIHPVLDAHYPLLLLLIRSEERRVGKEYISRRGRDCYNKDM